jgi:hypothetical protein
MRFMRARRLSLTDLAIGLFSFASSSGEGRGWKPKTGIGERAGRNVTDLGSASLPAVIDLGGPASSLLSG